MRESGKTFCMKHFITVFTAVFLLIFPAGAQTAPRTDAVNPATGKKKCLGLSLILASNVFAASALMSTISVSLSKNALAS